MATLEWIRDGLCLEVDPEIFFMEGADARVAKALCRRCAVIDECRQRALDLREEFGVFGGTDPDERRAILNGTREVAA